MLSVVLSLCQEDESDDVIQASRSKRAHPRLFAFAFSPLPSASPFAISLGHQALFLFIIPDNGREGRGGGVLFGVFLFFFFPHAICSLDRMTWLGGVDQISPAQSRRLRLNAAPPHPPGPRGHKSEAWGFSRLVHPRSLSLSLSCLYQDEGRGAPREESGVEGVPLFLLAGA
ncbi:hypothetical protein CH063_08825 [Colletotrichum higginsianum]|uniref:Uncharacterized protein n=1 Tax=Colletotrichum higginsianum (strain IMI 349063) TaxID=759273 RepID=H1VBA6_COLHI|nr:hypothetical protein CH063_08825 [Colletotrichum higginsianum]